MPLPAHFHRPFDRTYERVTLKVAAYPTADPYEQHWLHALIDGFQFERDAWDTTRELSPYFLRCARLKHRVLHLAVCAFLHISYDLPRVIADNWPGGSGWNWPSTARGQWMFFDLAATFPEALAEIARDRLVMGYPSALSWLVPPTAMEVLGHWVLHLRTAAWIHARLLHEEPGFRDYRERRMREAMTAALRRVSDQAPWSGALLHPPNPPPPNRPPPNPPPPNPPPLGVPAVLGLTAAELDHAWVGAAGVALAGAAAISTVVLTRRREAQLRRFLNELGFWTSAYVMKAATDPERGFDEGGESSLPIAPVPA